MHSLAFSWIVNRADAQAFLRLNPGLEISKVSEGDHYWGYVTDSADIFSPYFGLSLENKINSFLAIEINTSISRIKINSNDNGINPIRKLEFNQYSYYVLIGYTHWHNLTLSAGPLLYYIPKMHTYSFTGKGAPFKFNGKVFGIASACRWNYRNISVSILYVHSYNYVNKDSHGQFVLLKPFNSLELCVSFQQNSLKKFSKKQRELIAQEYKQH